jgi:hypothetical protein
MSISLLYGLTLIISSSINLSILQFIECFGYTLLSLSALFIFKKEYKTPSKNSVYLKSYWIGLTISQVLCTILVAALDEQLYFVLYAVITVLSLINTVLVLFFNEEPKQLLIENESIWEKFDEVTKDPTKPEKKIWNDIYNITIPNFYIDDEKAVYFKIFVMKGKKGEKFEELNRMNVEFNSLYDDYKLAYPKAKVPSFPPRVPQR